jgi:hypothetical protein
MHDFFVSYNSADRSWAEWIAWQLEEAGYTTIIQAWDFRPGSNFVLEMQRAATEGARTLAILSPEYLSALYTQPEWTAAFTQDPTGQQGKLLPVCVRACALTGMLRAIVYIDLVELSEAAAREALLAGVSGGRVKPQTPPSFPSLTPRIVPEPLGFPSVPRSAQRGSSPQALPQTESIASVTGVESESRYRLRILHLSDLHERGPRESEPWRRRRVLGEMWEDHLAELLQDGPIDLVCFTGDVADWGQAQEYATVTDFFEALLIRLSVAHNRLFVPGNHDITRQVENDTWRLLRDRVAQGADTQGLSRWMADHAPPPLSPVG